MINFYTIKSYYKTVSEDNKIKEIHYLCADDKGYLSIEKHIEGQDVTIIPLREI